LCAAKEAYRGRFAPSPGGPLHFGSLVAALASWLDARAHGGRWLVRMEDLDAPRCSPQWADDILRTLDRFGFTWDEPVLYQSRRIEAYREALAILRRERAAYPCSCSRRETGDGVYPGHCATGPRRPSGPYCWRVRVDACPVSFEDRLFGHYQQNLAREVGDFPVLRSDGIFAYQLAVVVDDAFQNITDVVRGADLLDSTPRQTHLQRLLRLPAVRYLHVPVAANAAGEKLSKQTNAPPLGEPLEELTAALRFLNQPACEEPAGTVRELLIAAAMMWDPARLTATFSQR
jgi:glutamyl-Q tRNA(Asp) synthetase